MKGEFTAIINAAPEGCYWAICPEIPGANSQGETIEEAKADLKEAVQLVLETNRMLAEEELDGRDAIRGAIKVVYK